MDYLTQPEPINHNELKRLLTECFGELFCAFNQDPFQRNRTHERVNRIIERAILDGDDS